MYFPIIPYGDEQEEIIGEGKSVIVRTLQVANGFGDAVIQIARLDSGGQIVFRNKFNLNIIGYGIEEDNLIYGMFLCMEIFWNKIKKDRKQKKI